MQPLQCGGLSGATTFKTGVTRLTLFLTFGVIALDQLRFPNLNVEGFVLLVLLVVNYSHLDGFTEEEGRKGARKENKKREEGRTVRAGQTGNWKKKSLKKKKELNISSKHVSGGCFVF